jgi:hypothetical protein
MHVAELLHPAAARPLRFLGLTASGLALTVGAGTLPALAVTTTAGRPATAVTAAARPAVTSLTGTPVAVSTLSTTDAWAVENSSTVLHWNGAAWAQTKLPEYGTGSYLEAVDALSPTDAWAAGFYDTSSSQGHPLLEHWNGSTWTRTASTGATRGTPSQSVLTGTFLQGVSGTSASSAWAVGYDVIASGDVYSVSVILRWNGTTWTRVPSPDPGGGTNVYLNAVTSVSATDAWAVGYYTTPAGKTQALTAHWNGSAWKVVDNPAHGDPDLLGVTADSSSDAWAVGSDGEKTMVLHWNGTSWTQVASPSPGDFDNALFGVSAVSPTQAWAAGSYEIQKPTGVAPVKTLLLRWNGSDWTQVTTPNPDRVSGLNGVSANSASSAWAVGSYQVRHSGGQIPGQTLMLRWNGTAWTRS